MPPDSLSLLIVEDNLALRTNIGAFLQEHGHRADFAADGRLGLQLALDRHYDAIILDLALPLLDGLQVCEQLRHRASRHIPILMLTARDTLDDKLRGFTSGADDYLTKPFAMQELLARCTVLSRRHRLNTDYRLQIGSLVIDRRAGRVSRHEQPIALHQTGLRILLALADAYPGTLTRSELTEHLWGDDPPDSDSLGSHIYLLRQALDRPFAHPMLKTVHGVGFRLESDTD